MTISLNTTFEEYLQLKKGSERNKLNALRRAAGLKPYHAASGKPSPTKGQPRPNARGPRPHMRGVKKPALAGPKPHRWLVGPDPERHDMYIPFLKSKAQANFRKEIWTLTFDQFETVWGNLWQHRGRASLDYCMVLIDSNFGWVMGNVEVITRREHLQRMAQERRGTLRRAK
jgi:hypothetical protein